MKESGNLAEDYAADESFQNYCLRTSKRDVKKWERKLKRQPEIRDAVEEARFLVTLFAPTSVIPLQKASVFTRWNIFKICALFLILIFSTYLINQYSAESFPEIVKHADSQNIEIHLSDLTKVNLREGSTIKYKESWENSKEREVWLDGEAYFDVTKSKPFLVHIPSGSIKVLGTKFLVKSDSLNTKLILEEGRINFLTGSKVFEMAPGDQLTYSLNKVSIQSGRDINAFHSWMKKSLSFKNKPLREVINTIRNSYDIDVVLENEGLAERKITTTIKQNDPLLLLRAIAEIYDIKMIDKQGKIRLK